MDALLISQLADVHVGYYYRALIERGHTVHLLGRELTTEYKKMYPKIIFHKIPNQRILRKISGRLLQAYTKKWLHSLVRKINADFVHLIHIDEFHFGSLLGTLTVPTIVTPVGSDAFQFPWHSLEMFVATKRLVHSADYVVTRSAYTRSFMKHAFGLPEQKLTQIKWGIDFKEILKESKLISRQEIKEKWGITPKDYVICLPRGAREVFSPSVNMLFVLKRLINKYSNVKVILMMRGSASFKNTAQRFVHESGIQDHIIWTEDFLSHAEFIQMMSICDAMVSLAKSDEKCIAILEAMYLGVVPILSDLAIYKEDFVVDKHYLAVNNGDPNELIAAISRTIDGGGLFKRQIAEANHRLITTKYDRSIHSTTLVQFYESVLAGTA